MTKLAFRRILSPALFLLAAHGAAFAEVSVQRNPDGSLNRVVYLTRGGRAAVVWGQVRPFLSPGDILNPLGDNLGDLPPVIARHPNTGLPWVVWSRDVANLKQVVFSTWTTEAGWTTPAPIVPAAAMPFPSELDPAIAFDATGTPLLVWWRAASPAEIQFSTRAGDVWTPPMRISAPGVDSRFPSLTVEGTQVVVRWITPAGPVSQAFDTTVLVRAATDLMDTPIPPGYEPPESDDDGGPDGDQFFFQR